MTTDNPSGVPVQPTIPMLSDEGDLRKALELRRILGDPRTRIEVPTSNGTSNPPAPAPAGNRYESG